MKWTQKKLKLNLPGKTWKSGALSPNREARNITERETGARRYRSIRFPDASSVACARYTAPKDALNLILRGITRQTCSGVKVAAFVRANALQVL